jgi:hypothetical protein
LAQVTSKQLSELIERGEISVTVEHRRQTLIAIAEVAKRSKGHTPMSRARLKAFRASLESEQNNDEIEVNGEIFLEIALHASATLSEESCR